MITDLRITNYALIKDIEVNPTSGFNIITGETGAGKSIILGALGLLQGNRADTKAIKAPDARSVVEAIFSIGEDTAKALAPIFKDADIPDEGSDVIMRREIQPSGRSRAFINDTPVTLDVMHAVAALLFDIHSQHNNMLLADSNYQLAVLDSLADNGDLVEQYHGIYADYKHALRRFAGTRDAIERTRTDADFIQYQLDELNNANLLPHEDTDLEAQRAVVAADEDAAQNRAEAAEALRSGDANVCDLLTAALYALERLGTADPKAALLTERLKHAQIEVEDIADAVVEMASGSLDSGIVLADIDDRLKDLAFLKSKHKVQSCDELIAMRDDLSARIAALNDADNVLGELEKEARSLKRKALDLAGRISERRKAAAASLAAELKDRAKPLGLANIVVDIQLTTGKLNPDGIDTVAFLFAFNKNQTPMPIGAGASGGEISRVMLALKSTLAGRIDLPTIIFDEIDTGVSGDVAMRMGRLMKSIAEHIQVFAITHLPAVAACGNTHFKVFKRDNETSTETFINRLDDTERLHEIASMLGGQADDPAALAAARSLIDNV